MPLLLSRQGCNPDALTQRIGISRPGPWAVKLQITDVNLGAVSGLK